MAEDSIAQVELNDKGGAPLLEGNFNSPNGYLAQAGSLQSSNGSGNKNSRDPADCYWFAQSGDSPSETKQPSERDGVDQDGKDINLNKDREERVRVLRERQAEERSRKLEELKSAAMQAQKFREIQEEERRRKIEEIKYRDCERRHLVEERKRQIWEAEKDRRETILRKSQEREARIEAVRNSQRSSIGFAFGSSIPRLLDLETSINLGRRSTSQTNVALIPATTNARTAANTNNQVDGEVRKRTSSAYTLDHRPSDSANHDSSQSSHRQQVANSPPLKPRCRGSTLIDFPWDTDNGEQQAPLIPTTPTTVDHRLAGVLTGSGVLVGENIMTKSLTSLSASVHRGRRKTDLIPTMPPNRESPRTRSPGRAYSMTRLDQLSLPRKPPLEALREENNKPSPNMIKTKSMTHLAFRKGGRNARGGADAGNLRASRSADPRMSKSTSHLAMSPLSVANSRTVSARTSPTRQRPNSGSTSPGRSLRTSSPGSEGSAKRLSQSMWYLASPATAPRPTRTSILRRGALTQAQQNGMSRSMMHLVPKQKEEKEVNGLPPRAPSSPSRPQSSLSQLSLSSHTSQSSAVSLRARSAPRRPRPLSVAGSIPDKQLNNEERQSRSSEKRAAMPPTGKPPRAKSVGADQVTKELELASSAKPPTPAPRRPPSAGARTPAAKGTTNPKEKPKIAPKPTIFRQGSKPSPLQSPTSEQLPAIVNKETVAQAVVPDPVGPEITQAEAERFHELLDDQPSVKNEIPPPVTEQVQSAEEVLKTEEPKQVEHAVETDKELNVTLASTTHPEVDQPSDQLNKEVIVDSFDLQVKEITIKEKPTKESVAPLIPAQVEDAVVSEGGPTPSKPKITTEEEAKAALAEKRRLAREQAEREAELERQRQEELRRQEEERLRREEEEQRLWEIEQERSRRAEEERLRKAIEEQQLREEEERLKKEEEAKQKVEKEKAERLAREEQEKIRKETAEKLRKEEEERTERRKRVEAIMSRTRGKGGNNTPPVTTPTKSQEPVIPSGEQREDSTIAASMTNSVEQNGKVDGSTMVMTNESQMLLQPDLLGNIANTEMGKKETNDNKQAAIIEKIETIFKEENGIIDSLHTNGFSHHEVVNQVDADLIMDSQSTPEKKASPLSDNLVEFDLLASNLEPTAPPMPPEMAQLIDLSLGTRNSSTSEMTTTTRSEVEHISNEDNVNFNVSSNGLDNPFVDNYTRHQETVTDFLS